MSLTISRRNFLQTASALAVGAAFPAVATKAASSPNDTIGVGLIGCRNMGWGVLVSMLKGKNVRCVALCDVDPEILAKRTGEIAEKHGHRPDTFSDYRRLLEHKDVDVVIVGTPDHWHCLQFVDACAAGKDVYVEKPAANSFAECDAMVAAAVRYGRVAQVGQQQRSSFHWQEMVKYLRTGALGTIGRVKTWAHFDYAAIPDVAPDCTAPEGVDYDMWLGPAPARPFNPQRFHGSWRMFWNYGGGLVTDWGVHLLDMALWGMDVKTLPLRTLSTGGRFFFPKGAHETFDTLAVAWQHKDFLMEWENSAGAVIPPHERDYGVAFYGTQGTLVADRSKWEVFPQGEKVATKVVERQGDAYAIHTANFLECVRTRNRATACTIENGTLCAKYAHLGNIGARLKHSAPLVYDEAQKKFDNPEANTFIAPVYRAPWAFPKP